MYRAAPVTAEDVRRLVAEVPHWHHQFEIFPGVFTPGVYRPDEMWNRLGLKELLDGKRALDIGACDGFYTKKLVELGAAVTAIDYRPKTDTGFWVVERCLGREIEFHNINVYDIDPACLGRFDIVLLLGVIYHLPDIPRMFYLARQLSKERLFVESHVEELGSELPLARYLPRDSLQGDITNFWAPNVPCVVEMLQDCGFIVVRVERWGSRALVEANLSHDLARYRKFDLAYDLLSSTPKVMEQIKESAFGEAAAISPAASLEQIKGSALCKAAAISPEASFISYSANFEDVILHRLFAGKVAGFYVDVGAGHPIYANDTMALYSAGWSGINVEPNPHFYELLAEHRTRDKNLCVALGDRAGETAYYEVVGNTGTGLSTCDPTQAERTKQKGYQILEHQIPILSLAQILSEARPPVIDLLKVDVEGFEEQVLIGNDWDRYRPSVVIVEATFPESPQRRPTRIRSYLEELGYQWAYFDGLNDFYVEKSFAVPQDAFSVPPNVFDRFRLLPVVELEGARAYAQSLEESVKTTEAYAQSLEGNLRSAQLIVADLEAERYRLETAASSMRLELIAATAELENALGDKDALVLCRAQAEQLKRDAFGASIQRANELAAVYASTSWKLTAPLRAFKNGLERIYRR